MNGRRVKLAGFIVGHVFVANVLSVPVVVALALWHGYGWPAILLTLAVVNIVHVAFAFGMAHEKGLV